MPTGTTRLTLKRTRGIVELESLLVMRDPDTLVPENTPVALEIRCVDISKVESIIFLITSGAAPP
jgi:hypothetical protein